MAPKTTDILEYMLLLCWTLLSLTPNQKNPVFAQFLPTQDTLGQLWSDSLLAFAPGLLDVLLSGTPPAIAYLKTLPSEGFKRFRVYLPVLEKSGLRPKIYIGSGTEAGYGVRTRYGQYDR
jgi:hypothetical protein